MALEYLLTNFDVTGFVNYLNSPEYSEYKGEKSEFVFQEQRIRSKWQLSYGLLEELWQIVSTLPRDKRSDRRVRDRTLTSFILRGFMTADFKNCIATFFELGGVVKKGGSFKDDLCKAIITSVRNDVATIPELSMFSKEEFRVIEHFTGSLMAGPRRRLDQLILAVCHRGVNNGYDIRRLNSLFSLVSSCYPDTTSVTLSERDEGQNPRLHVRRVSINEFDQTVRVIKDLGKLRLSEPKPSYGSWIIGTSWLVHPRAQRLFERMGLSPRHGVIFDYNYNDYINKLTVDWSQQEDCLSNPSYRVIGEYYATLLSNATESPRNLRDFISEGVFPTVGQVRIPTEVFFKGK